MNIEHPLSINFGFAYDEGQEMLMAETQILRYTDYLKTVAEQLGMCVLVSQVLTNEPNLDREDNRLLDKLIPLYQIKVMDEDELLGEFVYGTYSAQLYERFKDWVNTDILFYMKSKALYYDYDSKFPEKFTIKELAKKI